ncbi:MAG: FG-GAP-like repeat-containing protein [Myxococcota bacterium]
MNRVLAVLWLVACSETGLRTDELGVDPPDCPAPEASASVERDAECRGEPEIGTFEPVVQWAWTESAEFSGFHQIMASPSVGYLVDEDGDGTLGSEGDVPSVVFSTFKGSAYTAPGVLHAIRGDTGEPIWSVGQVEGHQVMGSSGVAIADLGDGIPTVLASSGSGVLALDGRTGAFRWHATVTNSRYGSPAVADLNGDGWAEVIYGRSVLSHDGAVLWTATEGNSGGFFSFGMDLDEDGTGEVVSANTVYEADGTLRWTNGPDGYPAVGDIEGDGVPEVITVSFGRVQVRRSTDGTLVWEGLMPDNGGGPPTVADFDGDGAIEIGVASKAVYYVFDNDGSVLWSNPVSDSSSFRTGSSVFDFEGDGAAEVVYADQETLFVWDGSSGAEELRVDEHSSGTLFEYPLVVDVDADGAAEIVVASNDYGRYTGSHGITIIQDQADSWAPARRVWNQYAWSISNIQDDGSVPPGAPGNWREWNSFRAGNSETASGLALPNLQIGDPVVCTLRCEALGETEAWVTVENAGDAAAGPFFVAVREPDGGTVVLLERVEGLAAGRATWVGPVTVTSGAVALGGYDVELDPDDEVEECDEDNNVASLTAPGC